MQCQKHKELLERWWNDQLTETERAALKAQLAECEDCQRELEGSRELWDLMGYMPVPEPSGEMQANFNAMLESYKDEVRRPAWAGGEDRRPARAAGRPGMAGFWQLFRVQPWLAAAFSLLLLAGGFSLGYVSRQSSGIMPVAGETRIAAAPPQRVTDTIRLIAPPSPVVLKPVDGKEGSSGKAVAATASQVQALSEQLREMRQMMMLSLLQNPSASERMRAASYASDSRTISPDILTALLTTLNNDPNVNVRLTTLDALTQYARNAAVREGLIQSILQQDSPLMQAALADVMLKLQEKRAVPSFKKLLQEKGLNDMVRSRIEQVIIRLT
jgi:anti-sigma factor RsiW